METMQRTLKNGRNVWDQINMPKAEFHERTKKIAESMEKEGIDVLLVYGNSNEYGNPCYLSNFVMWLAGWGVILVLKKDEIALIFEQSSRELPFAKSTTWVEDMRVCGDVAEECVKYLKEKNLIPSTVGFVGLKQLMPYYQLGFLSDSLSHCKIVDADHLLKDMRMVKSQKECDQIGRASRILTRAFDFIHCNSFPKLNERMLEAMVSRETRLEGVEDFRMLIAKPMERKWAFRPTDDTLMSTGDTIIIYVAVEFERYWSEGIRTFVAKYPSFVNVGAESIRTLYERMADGMKTGKKLSQFYGEILTEIRRSSVDYIPEYGLGQGIGLSLQEFPVIKDTDISYLKTGMCLAFRLAVKDREMGAIMIGNTIHISTNGPDVLTK